MQVTWNREFFHFSKLFWTFWTCHKIVLRSRDEVLWNCHYRVSLGSLENDKNGQVRIKNDQVQSKMTKFRFDMNMKKGAKWFSTFISRTDRVGSNFIRIGRESQNGQVEFVIVKIHLVTIITTVITYFCPILFSDVPLTNPTCVQISTVLKPPLI